MFGTPQADVPPALVQLADALSVDDAVDVRETIHHVNLALAGKGKSVPYGANAMHPPNHAGKSSGLMRNGESAQLVRRGSADVSARLGTMFLSAEEHAENDSTPIPKSPAESPSQSRPNPFAESFGEAVADKPDGHP